uniref:Ig-like domain-containing protein n=1 Tax=Oryzias latipes TaxID=8090 RepID=A0A3P9H199_ORYLA
VAKPEVFINDSVWDSDCNFLFLLVSAGFGLKVERLYKRVGEDVVLPCNVYRSSDQFYDGYWLFHTPRATHSELISCNDNVVQSSARASRLNVSSDCSLLITNITDEDAGRYLCRHGNNNEHYEVSSISVVKDVSVLAFPPHLTVIVHLKCLSGAF